MKGAFVITGAGKGLGRSLAEYVYTRGFPLALLSRTQKDLDSLQEEIEQKHGTEQRISCHAVDLTSPEDTHRVFLDVFNTHRGIQVLVNNAATWIPRKRIEDIETEEIEKSLNLNFMSAFNATQAVLKLRKRHKFKSLTIINIGATASLRGFKNVFPFCLGKGALRIFSQSLAREMSPLGVHVAHLIIDGLIDSSKTRELNPKLPAEQLMSPESISRAIYDLAMEDKSCWTFEKDVRPFMAQW